jgi:hypothetical protein
MPSITNRIIQNGLRISWWKNTAIPAIKNQPQATIARIYYDIIPRETDDILQEDWDQLMVLDACRFDLYDQVNWIEGEVEQITSPGSGTSEWLRNTFKNKNCYDTIYVTANPMYRSIDFEASFHAIIDVWDDYWDDELNTVKPNDMRDAILEAYEQYPNKKIISHWLQPHYPFIGETGQNIGDHAGIYNNPDQKTKKKEQTIWEKLQHKEVEKETVWKAYKENLEIALNEVEKLTEQIPGKTILTSDHGNMLGERAGPLPVRLYGHPLEIYTEELVQVPYHAIEKGERRKIKSSKKKIVNRKNSEDVKDRLQKLGYMM